MSQGPYRPLSRTTIRVQSVSDEQLETAGSAAADVLGRDTGVYNGCGTHNFCTTCENQCRNTLSTLTL